MSFLLIIFAWLIIRYLINQADIEKTQKNAEAYAAGRRRAQAEDIRLKRFAQYLAQEAQKTAPTKKPLKNSAVDIQFENLS